MTHHTPRINGGRTISIQRAEFSELAGHEQVQEQIIERFDLEPAEELWDFLDKVYMAVLALEDTHGRDYWLITVYDDSIIIEDRNNGKYYRLDLSRNEDGSVSLTNMTQVKVVYVPMDEAGEVVTRSAEAGSDAIQESDQDNQEEGEVPILRARIPQPEVKATWSGVLTGAVK